MKNALLSLKTVARHSVLATSLGLAMAACAQPQAPSASAPPATAAATAIAAPADERIAFTWSAVGTQNYACKTNDKGASAWAFVAPEADLFTAGKAKAGIHGAGPSWMALDGSKVNGSVQSQAAAGSPTAIPWLLLATQTTGSAGKLASVSHIQRINTVGGTAPASGCASASDAGQQAKVGYTADYVFFVKR